MYRSLLIVFVRLSLADLEYFFYAFCGELRRKEKNRTGKKLHAQFKFVLPICDVYYYIILYYIILGYIIWLICVVYL